MWVTRHFTHFFSTCPYNMSPDIYICMYSVIVEFWQVLAKESALTAQVLTTFIDMLKQNMPYEEKVSAVDKKRMDRIVTLVPLSVSYPPIPDYASYPPCTTLCKLIPWYQYL